MRRAIQIGCLAIPFLFSLFEGPDARACGGCFVPPKPPTAPPESVDSVITGERMIFSISKEQTTLYDEITYSGSPATFAWVLPIKGEVEVGLSADLLFSVIDHLTASTVTPPPEDCPPAPVCNSAPSGGGGFGCSASLSIPGTDSAPSASFVGPGGAVIDFGSPCTGALYYADGSGWAFCDGGTWVYTSTDPSGFSGYTVYGGPPVTVTANRQVGPYEMVQLHSTDGSALRSWLTSHGFNIPSADAAVISRYVTEGMDFLALKLVPGEGVRSMQPVRVTTHGASPILPLRMVGVGTGATIGVTLWVVAEGRWEPQNSPFFTISDSELAWDWKTSRSNFEELRQSKEAALHGAGWQVESSIDVSQHKLTAALLQAVEYGPNAGSYELFDAGADAATDTGIATVDADGDGALEASAGESGPGLAIANSLAERDLSVLVAGISGANVRITRLRADLAHAALSKDLVIQASSNPSELSNRYATTKQVGEPSCPVYDSNCNPTGEAPRAQAQADANGGCRTTSSRPATSNAAVVSFAALAGLGLARARRKRY